MLRNWTKSDVRVRKITKIINLLRPLELVLFSLFPLAGYVLTRQAFPPGSLIFASFILSCAIIIDNYVEGYLFHPDDAISGDYPVILTNRNFTLVRWFREILFLLFFTVLLVKSPDSFFFGLIVFTLIRVYNNRHLMVKQRPPFDVLCHFFGALVFYCIGCIWKNNHSEIAILPGIGMAALFSGGYLNHLLVDRVRDVELGLYTFAARIKDDYVRYQAGSLIVLGDILLVVYSAPDHFIEALIFSVIALIVGIFTIFVHDARLFRRLYRYLHVVGLLLIIILSLLERN